MISRGSGRKAILMLHGRGADAEDIIGISRFFDAKCYAFTAEGNAWYPAPFMQPKKSNDPFISNNLDKINEVISNLKKEHDEVFLLGFSQGACLALEYGARFDDVSGVIAFSGGFIGSDDELPSSFLTQKAVICCSFNDPFIPLKRAEASADICKRGGAVVKTNFYEGATHTITNKDIELAKTIFD